MVEEVGRIVRRRERRPGAPSGQARVHWGAVGLAIVQVDAFTDTPFRGNPAAVCVLPTPRDERWMQEVARDCWVEMAPEARVRRLSPDCTALTKLPVRAVIVTSRAAPGPYDFVSRFFAPGSGIPEDPVTGSSHCALGPFWSTRLGKSELLAYQASARGGIVRVRLAGDRVKLGGQAVTVLRGELV